MAPENTLSSISAFSAVLVIPITLVTTLLTDRGWNMLNSASRKARETLRPSEGTCEKKEWADLDTGALHICWTAQCHQMPHVEGPRCWERSLLMTLNHWKSTSPPKAENKPSILPLSKEFLCIDLKLVLAFLFMAVRKGADPTTGKPLTKTRTYNIAGVVLDIQIITSKIVLLHIEGSLQRSFTKDYVEHLFQEYPPLLNDPRSSSVFNKSDEKRGGWVVSLGLEPSQSYEEKDAFLPVYYDSVSYGGRRGGIFWRSMDRVRSILSDIWAKAFATDVKSSGDIALAIRALEYISEHETESGVESSLPIAMPDRPLSAQERNRIVTHFNGPPLIAANQEQQFRADWGPLLHYVLVAAVQGSLRCIAYFKNPGRELDSILPMDLLKSADLYLRGC